MATDVRNFRSSYYGKVGCNSVEEKKSLNKLLQDNVRNHAKLKQFCLSYTVPTTQRGLLWSIIFGILPLYKESTEYILQQRLHVYEDLQRAVTVMQAVDKNTSKSIVIYKMWLLENNRLLHTPQGLTNNDSNFVDVVKVLLQIFDNDVEVYWIAKEFYACTKLIQQDYKKLKELTEILLKLDDIPLYNHLEKMGIFTNSDVLQKWYATCFANVISESALIKVWDKICGGSRKIIVFLFVELVKALRESILNCMTANDFKTLIEQVKDQDAAIVNNAIKSWQNNKNHSEITVH